MSAAAARLAAAAAAAAVAGAADPSPASGPGPFGLVNEPQRQRYRLRLARYPAAAEQIDRAVGDRPALGLDAGSGRGRVAQLTRSPGLRWVGLDLSTKRLAIAKATGRYRLVHGNIRTLPFPRETFDVACCIQVLEHFDPPEARRLAASLGDLLKPGGLLLLSVPIFPASVVLLKRGVDAILRNLGRGPLLGAAHLSHFSLRTALDLVPPGFAVTDVRGVRAFSLPRKAFESSRWYYDFQTWLGRKAPAWTIEVNICARKPGAAPPGSAVAAAAP